jgi:predicted O-methyltransferase YrrM
MKTALSKIVAGGTKRDIISAINYLRLTGTYVEVGTFNGEFAEKICRFSQPSRLFCIDPYESYGEFRDCINDLNLESIYASTRARLDIFSDRIEFLRKFSKEAALDFKDHTLDFVYIDANHQYKFVLEDIVAWYPKVRAGGLLCGDDAVDTDDSKRNAEGDVEIVWERNDQGRPKVWGTYGIIKAVKEFAGKYNVEAIISGTQWLIQKSSES